MMDNKGLTLVLDEGRSTSSDFILDVVLDELSIPLRYKACFGIWLSSPLLHLQVRKERLLDLRRRRRRVVILGVHFQRALALTFTEYLLQIWFLIIFQLRPTHVPHLMAKHWPHFLRKFTLARFVLSMLRLSRKTLVGFCCWSFCTLVWVRGFKSFVSLSPIGFQRGPTEQRWAHFAPSTQRLHES